MEIICSNCGAPLVQLRAKDMLAKPSTDYVAQCPHCGDKSFWVEAPVDIMIGDTEYTTHINTIDNNNHYLLVTKAKRRYVAK